MKASASTRSTNREPTWNTRKIIAPPKASTRLSPLRDVIRSTRETFPKSTTPRSLRPLIGLTSPQLSGYSGDLDRDYKTPIAAYTLSCFLRSNGCAPIISTLFFNCGQAFFSNAFTVRPSRLISRQRLVGQIEFPRSSNMLRPAAISCHFIDIARGRRGTIDRPLP